MSRNTQAAAAEKRKPRLREVHQAIVNQHVEKRSKVLEALGAKSLGTFYDVLDGSRKLNPVEKQAIAQVYGLPVDAIDWRDAKPHAE